MELRPDSSHAWNAVGNVLLMQGDPEAVTAYEKAVELDPENHEARVNLQRVRGSSTPSVR